MGNPIILSVEGNIGSGKSTFLRELQIYLTTNNVISKSGGKPLKFCFLQEPVTIWQTIIDKEGKNILENYYADQKKYAFSFQMMAYISRLSILRNALKEDYDVIITERSIFTDKNVFAKMLYDTDKIEEIEYNIYNMWFREFIDELPKIYFVYVKTQPEIADERVIVRARPGETIPLEYLKDCHKYHEDWLNSASENTSILFLDGNIDLYADKENTLSCWFKRVEEFIISVYDV